MDYSTILRDNLLSAIEELKKKNNISSTNYYIHVCPDVSKKELSRILSTDLYYRERYINGAYETKSFNVDEFVKGFSPSFGLPLWMDMMLLSYNDDGIHIKLDMSIRFRKTKDLCYKETGHPPIRVL